MLLEVHCRLLLAGAVHPKKEIRAQHECTEAEAFMAKGALEAGASGASPHARNIVASGFSNFAIKRFWPCWEEQGCCQSLFLCKCSTMKP